MLKRVLLLSLLLMIPVCLFSATTGKIIGVVVDQATGEPLPGANVLIEGTSLGAATNAQGGFIILNVPPGTYTLKASFIGYQVVRISNVRVSVDLTTEVNFKLPTEAIEVQQISIVAERPLINVNATNETHIMTAEEIANMPVRTYAGVVATSPGVVSARGTLYVRGGRADEIAYYVDGVYSNDLRTGQRIGDIPITSLEQINYQAGGFNAEYGFANSGIVIASSKAGGNTYNISGEVITDEFLSKEKKTLGTYSYGYNVYNLTVGGPLLTDKVKFFLSGEKTYRADRAPSAGGHPVLDGNFTVDEILYTAAKMDSLGIPPEERILPVKLQDGPLPNNYLDRWNFNGNLLFDFNPVRIKVGGNGTFDDFSIYNQANSLVNYERNTKEQDYNYSVYGKISHTIDPKTFYEGTVYYSAFQQEFGDPYFWRNLADYGDATDFNGNGLYTPYLPGNSIVDYSRPRLGMGAFTPIRPVRTYGIDNSSVAGLKFDITRQQSNHELKAGIEYRYNTMRRFNVSAWRLAGIFANDPTIDPELAYRAAYVESFGYPQYYGDNVFDPSQKVDEGLNGAKHPVLASVYVQDKIELADLVLNLGLRWDYMNANDYRPMNPYDVKLKGGLMDEDYLEETDAHWSISPRLGLSFPVTDKTVFHAQFGKFTQQPELQYLYTGWNYLAAQLSQGNQVTVGNPDLKPVSTTAYELGLGQQLGLNSSISLTAYYKEIRDLVVLKNRVNAKPVTYAQYQNGDYGTVKGLSFTYRLRRTQRLSAQVNYTLQWASGTGSTAGSNFYITWIGNEYYPVFVAPLDYDQRHTASVNLDYRADTWGANVLASIGSGFPYTPKRIGDTVYSARFATAFPMAATNSAYTQWTYNIDLRLDKDFRFGNQRLNAYLWVLNLLGTKQPFTRKNDGYSYASGIYEATGRPDDNGWLSTPDGQAWVAANGGARAEALYRARINSPLNWEAPRQIRVGVRFDLNP